MEIDSDPYNPNQNEPTQESDRKIITLNNTLSFEVTTNYGLDRESSQQIRRIITKTSPTNKFDDQIYEDLGQINHENILKMINFMTKENNIFTEFSYEEYTLDNIIYGHSFLDKKDQVGEYLLQIAEAVGYLHGKLIFHSYINPKTIYVKNCITIKLGGFYFCEKLDTIDSTIDTSVNTRRHLYYNSIDGGLQIGLDYDMWCIGNVLFEMLFKQTPQAKIDVEVYKRKLPEEYKHTLKEPFKKLLRAERTKREWQDNQEKNWKKIKNKERIRNRYLPVDLLGRGASGHVYRVIDEETGLMFKVIKVINNSDPDGIDALREQVINKFIAKPDSEDETSRNIHVVEYYESFIESDKLCLVTEYCNGGDLECLISKFKSERKQIPENTLKDFIYQLIVGIKFIHGQGVTHRDIKPGNILLHRDPQSNKLILKYGDFGLAKQTEEIGGYFKTLVGTPRYAAPEIHLGSANLNNSIDIWSLGCVIYQLITLEYAFPNLNSIIDPNLPLPFHGINNTDYVELLSRMMQREPEGRATAEELRQRIINWRNASQ